MNSVVTQDAGSEFLVAQGRELLQQGERMEARRCLQRAVALDPGNADAWWLLGGLAEGRARMEYWMAGRRARFLAHRPPVIEDEAPGWQRLHLPAWFAVVAAMVVSLRWR
jgi:hypothetical protein